MNNKIRLLDSEELEQAAGGAQEGTYYTFKMNLYRGNTYDKCITVDAKPIYPAERLKICIHLAEHAPLENIHVYHLDDTELQYDLSNIENNIHAGTILKAVIKE